MIATRRSSTVGRQGAIDLGVQRLHTSAQAFDGPPMLKNMSQTRAECFHPVTGQT